MAQTVNLTGVLRYDPDRCCNGYTLLPSCTFHTGKGALLIDMNGRIVHTWEGVYGAYHNILFPDGSMLGTSGMTPGHRHDYLDVVHVNWDNKLLWKYNDAGDVTLPDGKTIRAARIHHDFQRKGNAVGYWCPNQQPDPDGNTLLISTKMVNRPDITSVEIADTWLIEVTKEGEIVWDWLLTDHWDELGFDEVANAVYARMPRPMDKCNYTKETYFNNCAFLGPNKWWDAGDERFNPENIIVDIRSWNTSFIISKATGKIVWKIGPDYESDPHLAKIGTIIGQHHVHMIQKGLPGEGNILIFDNGGEAGFGNSNPNSFNGVYNCRRWYSRVLEINPVTLELVWQYGDHPDPLVRAMTRFFSPYCSSAQRLLNGNTLICEAVGGRAFEVTPEGSICWEMVDPGGFTFRAYRYPYEWLNFLPKPENKAIIPPANCNLRLDNMTLGSADTSAFYTGAGTWLYH